MRFVFILIVATIALAADAPEILARRCASCHNTKTKTAGLDLSTRETAVSAGLPKILRRVQLGQMPPDGALPAAEQETIAKWIEAGAPWT